MTEPSATSEETVEVPKNMKPHVCRKCKGLTISLRDDVSRKIFRADAEPTPDGMWALTTTEYQVAQASKVDASPDGLYYSAHRCSWDKAVIEIGLRYLKAEWFYHFWECWGQSEYDCLLCWTKDELDKISTPAGTPSDESDAELVNVHHMLRELLVLINDRHGVVSPTFAEELGKSLYDRGEELLKITGETFERDALATFRKAFYTAKKIHKEEEVRALERAYAQ